MYVYLEGTWHPIADDEHTPCGLVVPPLTEWLRAVPDGATVHCGEGATDTVERAPKAKAKKG